MSDPITDEIVRQAEGSYRQFRENDPAFLDQIDEDVEWHVPDTLPGGGALRGQLAVLEFTDGMGRLWEDAYPEPEEFLPAGDTLVVLGTWRARARATGIRVEVPFAHVLRYRDGKLVYFYNYLDAAKALQSLEPR
jgi:ketosteroid isomerase-like protein